MPTPPLRSRIALAGALAAGPAGAVRLHGGDLTLAAGARADDNVRALRRGQIVNAPERDAALLLELDAAAQVGLRPGGDLRLVPSLHAAAMPVRLVSDLRTYQGGGDLELRARTPAWEGRVGGGVAFHHEPEEQFRHVTYAGRGRVERTLAAHVLGLGYDFSARRFSSDIPRMSYVNTDSTRHVATATWRYWQTATLRWEVTAAAFHDRWQGPVTKNLVYYSFGNCDTTAAQEVRRDAGEHVTAGATWFARPYLALGLKGEQRATTTNTDLDERAWAPRLELSAWAGPRLHLFADAIYWRLSYPSYFPHLSYENTRQDYRLEARAMARWRLSAAWAAQVRLNYVGNTANDSKIEEWRLFRADDASTVCEERPRSYSTFSRMVVDAVVGYTF